MTEFTWQEELIIGLAIVTIVLMILDILNFRKKEKDSIELGEKFDFRKHPWFRIGSIIAIFLLLFLVYTSLVLDWLPDEIERTKKTWFIPVLLIVPQFIEGIITFLISETKTVYYATEDGLLKSMKGGEIKKWNDFYGYTILEDENIVKFKTKNLKDFSIQCDKEYFKEYKKEIISFLDAKLTRQ